MNTATCQHCTTLFSVTAGSHGKFCSLSCGTSFRNILHSKNASIEYDLNPTKCNCCGTSIEYSKRKNKYCSASCAARITNLVSRKRGPTAVEKLPYSNIKFILCKHTNQFYSNKNPNGTTRRCSPYVTTLKEQYYAASRFKFNVYNYPEEFDIELILTHGWYTCPGLKRKGHAKNILGVSRDHLISVSYGFANNIDPILISHPANCRVMLHTENKIKHGKCDLTLPQLLVNIKIWNQKYTEQATGIEPATNSLEN